MYSEIGARFHPEVVRKAWMIARRVEVVVGNRGHRHQRVIDIRCFRAPGNATGANPVLILQDDEEDYRFVGLGASPRGEERKGRQNGCQQGYIKFRGSEYLQAIASFWTEAFAMKQIELLQ